MNNLSLLQQIRGSMRNPEPLSEENFYLAGRVRCIHIAERMDVTLPSVSRAVKELEKMGLSAPKMTYLMHSLAEKGYDLSTDILTVSDAAGEILNLWRKTRMEDGEK